MSGNEWIMFTSQRRYDSERDVDNADVLDVVVRSHKERLDESNLLLRVFLSLGRPGHKNGVRVLY